MDHCPRPLVPEHTTTACMHDYFKTEPASWRVDARVWRAFLWPHTAPTYGGEARPLKNDLLHGIAQAHDGSCRHSLGSQWPPVQQAPVSGPHSSMVGLMMGEAGTDVGHAGVVVVCSSSSVGLASPPPLLIKMVVRPVPPPWNASPNKVCEEEVTRPTFLNNAWFPPSRWWQTTTVTTPCQVASSSFVIRWLPWCFAPLRFFPRLHPSRSKSAPFMSPSI